MRLADALHSLAGLVDPGDLVGDDAVVADPASDDVIDALGNLPGLRGRSRDNERYDGRVDEGRERLVSNHPDVNSYVVVQLASSSPTTLWLLADVRLQLV